MSVDWSEVTPTMELVCSMVTVPEILEMLGVDVDASGMFRLREEDSTPSVKAYEDHAYDFGSGQLYSPVDIAAKLTGRSLGSVMHLLWTRALRSEHEPGDVERLARPEPVDLSDDFYLMEPVGDRPASTWRLEGCPIPAECRIGHDGSLLIPHVEGPNENGEGVVYGVKVRQLDGRKVSWPGSQFTRHLYRTKNSNVWSLDAVIVEGESDCWALQAAPGWEEVDVFALPSGAGAWKDHWLEELAPYDTVMVIMDNDRAGELARDKLSRTVGWGRVENLYVPSLMNDVREAIGRGWVPVPV